MGKSLVDKSAGSYLRFETVIDGCKYAIVRLGTNEYVLGHYRWELRLLLENNCSCKPGCTTGSSEREAYVDLPKYATVKEASKRLLGVNIDA